MRAGSRICLAITTLYALVAVGSIETATATPPVRQGNRTWVQLLPCPRAVAQYIWPEVLRKRIPLD